MRPHGCIYLGAVEGMAALLDTDYLAGPVAVAVSHGALERSVILRTRGGRARAIECGQLHIDVVRQVL
jgi:citrate lyase subunit alpha / citrate CoA-transferase